MMLGLRLKWCLVFAACVGHCLDVSIQPSDSLCALQTGLHAAVIGTAPDASELAKQVLKTLPPDVSKLMQKMRNSSGTFAQEPQCKQADVSFDHLLHPSKYRDRTNQCGDDRGMWKLAHTAPVRQFKYETMVQVMGLTQGHRVMDWGTGCGKELSVTADKFGFKGFGIDVVQGNIDWATSHFHNTTYCLADGSTLPFQDASFDAVISNAALYHLNGIDPELKAVHEILRVLRPGGCGWMAWLGTDGDKVTQQDWNTKVLPGAVLTTLHEKTILGKTEYDDPKAYSLIFCKKGSQEADETQGGVDAIHRQ